MFHFLLSLFILLATVSCKSIRNAEDFPEEGKEMARVVSAFRVGFSLIEKDNVLYFAYYDGDHRMTLATYNTLNQKTEYCILPSEIGWDSHNYITMTFDKKGYLHLAGNMHAVPLLYFRSEKPYDIHSMKQIKAMTGKEETRVTYPQFMKSPQGDLIFHYRTGGSGNGSEIYNIYNVESEQWTRLLDTHLIDGGGKMNAYMNGPKLGKDGYYHMAWVWRDTPDCSTNHTLSYARSKDLIHWETADGIATELPITFDKKEFYVDPTPAKGGLFNPAVKLGFDSKGRAVIGYMKYDRNGNNQLYATRHENGGWNTRQITSWNYRWQFQGGGSMLCEIGLETPKCAGDGKMSVGFSHSQEGKGNIIISEESLEPLYRTEKKESLSSVYTAVRSDFPRMEVRFMRAGKYLMRWESLPSNRDRKPQGELPPPSPLILYKLK